MNNFIKLFLASVSFVCFSVALHASSVDGLVERIDVVSLRGLPSLHKAIISGDKKNVFTCLTAHNVNQQDQFGNTPLHLIMLTKRWDIMDPFLLKGANCSIKNRWGLTPEDMKDINKVVASGMISFLRLLQYSNL